MVTRANKIYYNSRTPHVATYVTEFLDHLCNYRYSKYIIENISIIFDSQTSIAWHIYIYIYKEITFHLKLMFGKCYLFKNYTTKWLVISYWFDLPWRPEFHVIYENEINLIIVVGNCNLSEHHFLTHYSLGV